MNAVTSQYAVAQEYLRFADTILKNGEACEGELRSAMSRAYYAVLLTARDQLFGPDEAHLTKLTIQQLREKKEKTGPNSHELVIRAIAKRGSLVLSQQLRQLRQARVHADYHFTDNRLSSIPKATWQDYAVENVAIASQALPMARRLKHY